jgi:putative ABC transport system permease protein
VAERLGYKTGDRITLSHGMGHGVMAGHDDKPFVVSGILTRTGTPVDRSVHVSLEAIEALHLDWQGGARLPGMSIAAEHVQRFDLSPKSVTAVLVGLHQRAAVFNLQRQVAQYRDEPLLAVLPGVALDELWRNVGTGEKALLLVSAMVVAVGLAGLIAVILTGLDQRRRELAILRSVGAHPLEIYALLALEGLLVTLGGLLLGMLLLAGLVGGLGSQLAVQYGIILPWHPSSSAEWRLLGWVILAGFSASLVPGYRAYRLSLSDGLTPRV